jgi:hypothetical protein
VGAPSPENDSSWKRDLAIVGVRFAAEFGLSRLRGQDPDRVADAERLWRAFSSVAEIPEVRTKLHDMTRLDGPELVRVVRQVVEMTRSADQPPLDGAEKPSPEVEKRQRREPVLAP